MEVIDKIKHTKKTNRILRKYLKHYGGSIINVYNLARQNCLHLSTSKERNELYGLVDRIQYMTGGMYNNYPMNEYNFTSLLKNVTDNNYLNHIIKTGRIGGGNRENIGKRSSRIKPLYNDYLDSFK